MILGLRRNLYFATREGGFFSVYSMGYVLVCKRLIFACSVKDLEKRQRKFVRHIKSIIFILRTRKKDKKL